MGINYLTRIFRHTTVNCDLAVTHQKRRCDVKGQSSIVASLGLALLAFAPCAQAQTNLIGQWSNVVSWPVEAIHVALLPTGKVIFWQSWNQSTGLWDPTTSQFANAAFP